MKMGFQEMTTFSAKRQPISGRDISMTEYHSQPFRRFAVSARHFYFSFLLQQFDAQSEGEICKS